MTDRSKTPWAIVPEDATVDDVMSRLWDATRAACMCAVSSRGTARMGEGGCDACDTWDYVCGTKKERP